MCSVAACTALHLCEGKGGNSSGFGWTLVPPLPALTGIVRNYPQDFKVFEFFSLSRKKFVTGTSRLSVNCGHFWVFFL